MLFDDGGLSFQGWNIPKCPLGVKEKVTMICMASERLGREIDVEYGLGYNGDLKILRVRAIITSQSWRPDLGQIRPIGNRKTTVIAGLFRGFCDFRSVEDGRKMGCQNVKLFLREP